ncbi:hypothetical protein [Sediminitomix flava]|nr:hypothetical protein [Sediminitomix flava]
MQDKEKELQQIRKEISHLKFRESMLMGTSYYSNYCRTTFDKITGKVVVRLKEKAVTFPSSEGVEEFMAKIDEEFQKSNLEEIMQRARTKNKV